MRVRGLLPGAKITKSLLAVPPPMTGLVTIPTFYGWAINGGVVSRISAGGASYVGKESGESFGDAVRDQGLDGSGLLGSESGRAGVTRGLLLGLFAEGALVVDEGLKFCLSNIIGVNIFDPRTMESVISPSPKRVNEGNESGLPIEFFKCKSSGEEAMVVGRDVFARTLRVSKIIIGGRDGVGAAGPIGREDREVCLSADILLLGRDASKHIEVSFLYIASYKAGELYLHGKCATSGGKVVAPLRYSQKTIRWARSTGLERDVRNPSGKAIVGKDEIQTIRGCRNKSGVHF
jgi:hypothetical protein